MGFSGPISDDGAYLTPSEFPVYSVFPQKERKAKVVLPFRYKAIVKIQIR